MRVIVLELTLHVPWVHSLKEKRMEVRSLVSRLRNKFNVSVCEAEEQDTHQTIVLGVVCVAANTAQGDSIADKVVRFVEGSSQGEVIKILREVY